MVKILIKNPKRYLFLNKIFLFGRLFSFYIPALDDIKDDDLFKIVVATVRYGDSTGKETRARRFDDLDEVLDLLPQKSLAVHDVGCSSGVTSLDLMRALNSKNKSYSLIASDRFTELFVYGGNIKYLFDSDRSLRQIYLGRVLCDSHLSKIFFLSRFLFKLLETFSQRDSELKTGKKISLFDRDVQKSIDSGQLKAKSYNIFERDINRYGFIRCMNLLNRSYFSDIQIKVGIINLFESLDDKGYLQIGRTDDHGVNRASVYRKEQWGLSLVLQFNGGAEIGNIIEMMEIDDFN